MSDFLSSQPVNSASFAQLQSKSEEMLNRANALARGGRPSNTSQKDKIDEVAKGFESTFLGLLMKEMRKTINKANFLEGNSSAMRMYEEMMDERLVEGLSDQNVLGVGKMVKEQLKELTENVYDTNSKEFRQRVAEASRKFAAQQNAAPAVKEANSATGKLEKRKDD